MPYWGWILIIVGLSILALAVYYGALHLAHRTMPARQAPQGDPERDISAPIPIDVANADDLMASGDEMTARELDEERQRESRPRTRGRAATYELALPGGPSRPPFDVVTDMPPTEVGQVIFHQGSFWRVDSITRASSQKADGRLVVSRTTDAYTPRVRSR